MTDELFVFDSQALDELAVRHAVAYRAGDPFPHAVIDGFVPASVAQRLADEFPRQGSGVLRTRNMAQQPGKYGTLGGPGLLRATPFIQHMLWALNSFAVLDFLHKLTGIEGLLADPYFSGGGLHQIVAGGHLDVHADFSHDERIRLHRRINLLLYLNPEWRQEWGGQLELWRPDLSECARSIAPLLNRCVIFNTARDSFHGHPRPLATPEGVTRNSIAIYYYTVDPPAGEGRHATLWQKV